MIKVKGDCLLTKEIVTKIAFYICSYAAGIAVGGEDFGIGFGEAKGGGIFDENTI